MSQQAMRRNMEDHQLQQDAQIAQILKLLSRLDTAVRGGGGAAAAKTPVGAGRAGSVGGGAGSGGSALAGAGSGVPQQWFGPPAGRSARGGEAGPTGRGGTTESTVFSGATESVVSRVSEIGNVRVAPSASFQALGEQQALPPNVPLDRTGENGGAGGDKDAVAAANGHGGSATTSGRSAGHLRRVGASHEDVGDAPAAGAPPAAASLDDRRVGSKNVSWEQDEIKRGSLLSSAGEDPEPEPEAQTTTFLEAEEGAPEAGAGRKPGGPPTLSAGSATAGSTTLLTNSAAAGAAAAAAAADAVNSNIERGAPTAAADI